MQTPEPKLVAVSEPDAMTFAGPGIGPSLRRAWLATRPQFLTASALPVILGTAWGAGQSGRLDLISFVLALLGVALLHAASNVWNDVGDEQCGTDSQNNERIYPFTGGSRFIQNGVLSLAQMTRLSLVLAIGAGAIGALLIWLHGWPILVLGALGGGIGGLYSWPRVQLAGRGLGELAVALAFGVLPVCGAAWLQQGSLDSMTVLLGLPVACWVAAVLLINEVPDCQADSQAGKRTLPVRLGLVPTGVLYAGLQGLALVGVVIWQQRLGLSAWPLTLFALLGGLGLVLGYRLAARLPGLPGMIRLTLALHAAGCLGLVAWIMLAGPGL
ncbi:MAG: prenyltransferase [Gammaproteobacteria bacterium]